jgi:phosphatidylinositol 4-kinase A
LGTLTKHEKQLFERESHFFENITHISSILNPKMSKDEKRRIIKEQLTYLNQEVPEGVYLPNNPSYIVQSIVETSGTPMQSAEKCPILVAFRVIEKKSMHDILVEEKTIPEEITEAAIEEEKMGRLSTIINRPGRLSEDSIIEKMMIEDESEEDGVFHSHRHALRESYKRNLTKNVNLIDRNSFRNLNSILNQHHFKRTNSAFDNSKNKITMKPETRFTGVLNQIKGVDKADKSTQKKGKEKIVACIFKTKDDVRQDVLALKIVKLFKDIFKTYQLDLHLVPYNVICNRTGEDNSIGGIIECIPNCHSRDELGKDYDVDMYQYFIEKFGGEESSKFRKAQLNFIRSLAGYSIFSYIVQTKDRHNGNIMIDADGNIIHIDFGFIFDWSPGGDMRFETADFKFTKEMIKILGGDKKAPGYQLFVRNTIQGFLAVRKFAKQICDLAYFSFHSGLPCFKERSMRLLKKRFRSELSECEAAEVMRKIINNAHTKWTTKVYDQVQYIQNKIAY